jgi:hypothetical protein
VQPSRSGCLQWSANAAAGAARAAPERPATSPIAAGVNLDERDCFAEAAIPVKLRADLTVTSDTNLAV